MNAQYPCVCLQIIPLTVTSHSFVQHWAQTSTNVHKQTHNAVSPQCPAPLGPVLFMGGDRSSRWEPRVSRSALIDDSICHLLPVRALNLGWRETFGHEKESFPCACLLILKLLKAFIRWKAGQGKVPVWCKKDRTVTLIPGWMITHVSRDSYCCFLCTFISLLPFLTCILRSLQGNYFQIRIVTNQ